MYYTDGDIIALQGDYVQETFFVHEGKLELRIYDFPDRANPWTILEASHKDELAGYEYTIQGRMKRTYYFGHASTVHGGTWPGTVVSEMFFGFLCFSIFPLFFALSLLHCIIKLRCWQLAKEFSGLCITISRKDRREACPNY